MSVRLFAAMACCLLCASDCLAQYQSPAYSNQAPYQAQQNRNWSGIVAPGQGQNQPYLQGQPAGPGMSRASARIPQNPPYAMQEAAAQGAPSMVAPSCDSNYGGCDSDSGAGRGQVGADYFGRSDCGSCSSDCGNACGCSDRYFRVFGGWNWLQDMDVNFQTAGGNDRASFNDGWAIGGAVGKYITQNTRREFEFTYRNNTADSIAIPGPVPVDGVINCYSIMGNLVYELSGIQVAGFQPYVGGGLGIAFVEGEFGGGAFTIDDTAFAYQGFFGVDRELSSNAKLFAEYRYFGTSEIDIIGAPPSSDNYQANNLFFGLQISR